MLLAAEIGIRLTVAALLAGIIGIERERNESAAGMRTHALVGLGSALFMIVSAFGFGDILGTPNVNLDPSRIAAQVASGIGFLGAGTIIFRQDSVRGLTTAASIWVAAAVGLACGGGIFAGAAMATTMVLVILAVLKPLEARFAKKRRGRSLCVVFDPSKATLSEILTALAEKKLAIRRVALSTTEVGFQQADVRLAAVSDDALQAGSAMLRALPGITEVSANIR